jgi:hypothetical protein
MVLHGSSNAGQLPRCPVPKKQQQKQPETKTVDIATQCEKPLSKPKNSSLRPSNIPLFLFSQDLARFCRFLWQTINSMKVKYSY